MSTQPHCRCGTCGWSMRPTRTTLADYPNTRIYKHPGICTICHRQAQASPRPTFEPAAAAAALGYWLRDRRNRGVSEQGHQI